MILGTGIDIIEVPRIAAALERHGDRFLQRIYTPAEIAYCRQKANAVERFAARFAAKEAAAKALGTGIRLGVAWRDLEVTREPGGRPMLAFYGHARVVADRLGVGRSFVSLSHTAETAIAQVVLESVVRAPRDAEPLLTPSREPAR